MTATKAEIIHQLYDIAENMPTNYLHAAEFKLTELIGRLQALNSGSSNPELEGVISSLSEVLNWVDQGIRMTINATNDISRHAGAI